VTDSFDLFTIAVDRSHFIYRYRDGLYAVDLDRAISHLDFFSWLNEHPADLPTICRSLDLGSGAADVMLTVISARALRTENGRFLLTIWHGTIS